MKWWRTVGNSALALSLAGGLAACSGAKPKADDAKNQNEPSKPSEPVELTLLSHYVGNNETALKPYIDQWNKENPNIQIKLTPVDFGELLKTIMTKQSAGQGADIMHVYTLWGGQLAKNKVLADAPANIVDDIKKNYPPAAVKGASLNGKVFGYPTEVQTYGLFYNKKLLKDAGFDSPPKTWDEMLNMAKKNREERRLRQSGGARVRLPARLCRDRRPAVHGAHGFRRQQLAQRRFQEVEFERRCGQSDIRSVQQNIRQERPYRHFFQYDERLRRRSSRHDDRRRLVGRIAEDAHER
ncbi:hypothetical protein SD70_25765 [Gordoniibacillus kamchatkensis]|uniref:Extracellular solute-binding protein n=1 Tax=Gordoniibacillus kamchatkensis TaxID=1590651 RepID=A0ABR5ABU9_9BACL|nr:hypothetical protein SD70_25765 [Paenibacillus sp. VKM B-2647]